MRKLDGAQVGDAIPQVAVRFPARLAGLSAGGSWIRTFSSGRVRTVVDITAAGCETMLVLGTEHWIGGTLSAQLAVVRRRRTCVPLGRRPNRGLLGNLTGCHAASSRPHHSASLVQPARIRYSESSADISTVPSGLTVRCRPEKATPPSGLAQTSCGPRPSSQPSHISPTPRWRRSTRR